MSIWFTSDLHLGHKAILEMCGRPFSSIEEHDRTLIANINEKVMPEDTLYVLGDASYRISKEKAADLLSQIRCKNVHLINGNHDRKWVPEDGVFETVSDYLKLKYGGLKIICMHYPMLEWDGSFYNSVHLHGHQHNKADYNRRNAEQSVRRYDVGVDANGYSPVSLDDILDLFR